MPQIDPTAGTGTLIMTAYGLVPAHLVQAYLREEADRLRKQEPIERTYC